MERPEDELMFKLEFEPLNEPKCESMNKLELELIDVPEYRPEIELMFKPETLPKHEPKFKPMFELMFKPTVSQTDIKFVKQCTKSSYKYYIQSILVLLI